jgi:hypothetical protein
LKPFRIHGLLIIPQNRRLKTHLQRVSPHRLKIRLPTHLGRFVIPKEEGLGKIEFFLGLSRALYFL